MDLAGLLHPHDVDTFFGDIYERHHLLIERNQPGYYDALVTEDDLDRLLVQQNLNPAMLMLVKDGTVIAPDRWTRVNELLPGPVKTIIRPEKVFELFHDGATIVVNNADKAISRLTQACRAFEQETHIRVQANIYITPPAAQGFAAHFDDHDIFVMQVRGAKRWRLFESGEQLPITYQPFAAEPRVIFEATLRPGDLLYLPRGVPHEAFSTDSATIHLNFAFKPQYGVDALKSLAKLAEKDIFFRRAMPNRLTSSADRERYFVDFAENLQHLLKTHLPQRLITESERDFTTSQTIDRHGALHTALRVDALTVDTVVRRWPGITFLTYRDERETIIEFAGQRLTIPAFVDPALLLSDGQFRVGAIQGMITDNGRIALVRSLARAGCLQIVPG